MRTPRAVVDRVTLVVSDLDRAEADYVTTFGCRVVQRADIEPALLDVLCVKPARGRLSCLQLGRERIEFLEFTDTAGRAYPPDSTSTDLWFQHMAIIVSDMTAAHRLVSANPGFRPISRDGPVRLPDSSGGLTAFKFRDHDGHPLELLAFPAGRIPPAWRDQAAGPFLGLDHTAIAVRDSAVSTAFFRAVFGFRAGSHTENRGPEQAALDDVDDVEVGVTPLGPDLPAPRLELLRYHVGLRRPIPADTASNDILATHSVVQVDSLAAVASALERLGRPLAGRDMMTLLGGGPAALVEGPDGHRFLVKEKMTGR
jgi:catechol 2,3-dioxygenase-like lactoylglutathione lyase family enzyme